MFSMLRHMFSMLRYAPSAAFYLLALAAQVSGYTNPLIAAGLVAIATILLIIPAGSWIRKNYRFRLPWISKKTPESHQSDDDYDKYYTDDPEGEAKDPIAYRELLAFTERYLVSACETKIELQNIMVRVCCTNDYIGNLAINGSRSDAETNKFFEQFKRLYSGLMETSGSIIRFDPLIDCIFELEQGLYRKFCEHCDSLAKTLGLDQRTNDTLKPHWEAWRDSHNALVDAYEKIKTDPRFDKLLRFKPSRWGEKIKVEPPEGKGA